MIAELVRVEPLLGLQFILSIGGYGTVAVAVWGRAFPYLKLHHSIQASRTFFLFKNPAADYLQVLFDK